MRQTMCRRLKELEKINAAAAERARASSVDHSALNKIAARLEAWRASPELAKLVAESPPDFLHNRVQELRAQLRERASSHARSAQAGGF
jgi:hypothetical protein